MKPSPTMQQVIQQIAARHGVDPSQPVYLRLDMPERDSLVIDYGAKSLVAVVSCFEECGEWKVDREVLFFTGYHYDWIPIEITQLATGWTAYAKLDATGQHLVRINHCGQERLAEFTERWAQKLARQNWLEQGVPYEPWIPPSRRELS